MKNPFKLKPMVLACAVALACPLSALAQQPDSATTNATILKELQALKARVQELEARLGEAPAPQKIDDMSVDINRLKLRADKIEGDQEDNGFSGLKISGYVDPTYIYNQKRGTSSFVFLNGISGQGNTGLGQNAFGYDNSYFGTLFLHVEKTFENGGKGVIEITPKKGYDEGNGSIINQANFSMPVNDQLKVFAGQVQSFEGYEYQAATQRKNITYNLLFDFAEFTYITGAGLEWVPKLAGSPLDIKLMVGNPAVTPRNYTNRSTGVHGRFDYAVSEFSGIGGSFYKGKLYGLDYQTAETDFSIAKGDWTYSGQISVGKLKNGASNGGDAAWTGMSLLSAYKFTPRDEGVLRFDYIRNSRNGGGNAGATINPQYSSVDSSGNPVALGDLRLYGDPFNGFGPEVDPATGLYVDPNKGANRYALTATYNYLLNKNATVRAEYRYDGSTLKTFYNSKTGAYSKSNNLLGLQLVYSF